MLRKERVTRRRIRPWYSENRQGDLDVKMMCWLRHLYKCLVGCFGGGDSGGDKVDLSEIDNVWKLQTAGNGLFSSGVFLWRADNEKVTSVVAMVLLSTSKFGHGHPGDNPVTLGFITKSL